MSARDELAEVVRLELRKGSYQMVSDTKPYETSARRLADQVLAAGYRKPPTITTAEELYALPVGSIIRDHSGLALQFRYDGCWWCTNGDTGLTCEDIATEALPATILWEPQP